MSRGRGKFSKRKMHKSRRHKTRKYKGGSLFKITQKSFDDLVKGMLEVSIIVKLHHWNTMSYSTHKATDSLYDSLSDNIDKYVEVMIGKSNGEYRINKNNYEKLKIKNISNNSSLEKQIKSFISELNKFHSKLDSMEYSDVNNIKDEIVGELNKFLYLLTLK
jgi:DNA-binding ferritin-like protein